jgi:formylglycine-generating enzyme required for sulfatase activity
MRLLAAIACTVMLICLGIAPGQAEKRVALVIGNSGYRNVSALPNTKNDANDIAASFERLGFSVNKVMDGTFDDMRRALLQFGRDARGTEIAVIFFAGHGMEIGGENWLIPVDAELGSDTDAENEAVSLRTVMLQVAGASNLGLVILDACRNNPFAAKMQRTIRTRAVDRGLVRTEPTDNVLVAYAARDGTTAKDGEGRNSPFSAALLKNLETPGLEVTFLFRNVRDDVMAATKREQQPFVYGSLSKEQIYLKAPDKADRPNTFSAPRDPAAQTWAITKDTTSVAVLEDFVRQFSATPYGSMARARLEELKRVAAVAPPVAPARPCSTTPITVSWPSRMPQPLSAAEECALKPKDAFKECDKCPEMVVLPAGSFTMGSPASEAERSSNEGPQHSVTISKPFAVGRFAVTFEEWEACVADGGCNGYKPADQGWGRGRRPVTSVTWDDAKTYVAWLSRKTGKTYRLLSEAEREYGTRAGATTPFWWGASISTSQANYDGNYTYGGGSKGEYRQKTLPVDSLQPNSWGLYQVHGNVYEWVEDCYHDSHAEAPTDGAAWISGECSRRVLRGGSWVSNPKYLRSAFRYGDASVNRGLDRGFRLGRTL